MKSKGKTCKWCGWKSATRGDVVMHQFIIHQMPVVGDGKRNRKNVRRQTFKCTQA